jgi:hypothetical protein
MLRARIIRRLGPLALVALLPLGAAACSKADQDRADQKAGEARQAGDQVGQQLENLGDQAREKVQQAADQLRDGSKDVREAAARNAVSAVAEGEFQRHGVDFAEGPTCAATSDKVGQYHIECTAKTTTGGTATLVGDDPGEGDSNFVGAVDGKELFRQQCVGLC